MADPDEAAWQAAGETGNRLVRDVLAQYGLANPNAELLLATGFGALTAAVEFLVALSNSENSTVLEQWALAYARGAIRGTNGPIHDDGRPMQRAHDA